MNIRRALSLSVAGISLLVYGCHTLTNRKIDKANAAVKRKDYATAMTLFKELAKSGDAEAQYNVGVIYSDGLGVPKDDAEAAKWYAPSAEAGNASAQCNLGNLYRNGSGVPKDLDKALMWLRKAVDQGDATAQFNLATMLESGEGVTADPKEAVRLYQLAAQQGRDEAKVNLGAAYANGTTGVGVNRVEAQKWFILAGKMGDENRSIIAKQITPEEQARAEELAAKWRAEHKTS